MVVTCNDKSHSDLSEVFWKHMCKHQVFQIRVPKNPRKWELYGELLVFKGLGFRADEAINAKP